MSEESLLTLVQVYISGEIPCTAKLDVLVFLSSHVVPSSKHDHAAGEARTILSDLSIDSLVTRLSRWEIEPSGVTVYDVFLRRLWELNNLDSLFSLFEYLGNLCKTPSTPAQGENSVSKLSRASPLGQFVRRCCYEFERLQFADAQKLWTACVSYRAKTYSDWALRHPDAAQQGKAWSNGETLQAEGLEQLSLDYMSTQNIDNLLTSSIQQLQKLGTRVPTSIKSKLEQWFDVQQDTNIQSLRHFMQFFEYWKAGQMSMALEALHQYFDYSVGANRGGENLKVYFQYAQLHQSVLYADFECWEESVNAMSECIATARENQDTACLSYALSWLLHLRQVHPDEGTASFESLAKLLGGSTEHDEIAFLKSKARETKQWALLSSTLLEEAKLELHAGGNMSKAMEHILQSMFLNVQHDQRGLMTATTLFESGSLERLGQSRLSYRICQCIMLLHQSHAPLNDRVRALCRTAHILAQMGRYSTAENVLEEAEKQAKGVLRLQHRVATSRNLLTLRRSIHRHQLPDAKVASRAVQSQRSTPEIDLEAKSLQIAYNLQSKEYEKALAVVNRAIEKLKQRRSADIAHRLQLLVLKSKVFVTAGQPAKGFTIIMRAALTAERHLLIPILNEAIGVLGSILNSLGEFDAVRELMEATLPNALTTGNVQLEAELFLTLADAHTGLAGQESPGSQKQLARLKLSAHFVERSRQAYHKLENVSEMSACLLKRSVLESASGDDDAALLTDEMYFTLLRDPDSVILDKVLPAESDELGL